MSRSLKKAHATLVSILSPVLHSHPKPWYLLPHLLPQRLLPQRHCFQGRSICFQLYYTHSHLLLGHFPRGGREKCGSGRFWKAFLPLCNTLSSPRRALGPQVPPPRRGTWTLPWEEDWTGEKEGGKRGIRRGDVIILSLGKEGTGCGEEMQSVINGGKISEN